ncbi:MAG TPA: Uma2 family endonuclease [Dehalococcoidia bacterium]|nr:Uma2 family endonuclease [Dehalococcoidia bacterium]
MPISFETYARVVQEDTDAQWELVCGTLRQKPAMTIEHDGADWELAAQLAGQVDQRQYLISQNARLRVATGSYYIPDVCVIPVTLVRRIRRERPRELAVLDESLPLVVEIWSPSTGTYDIETKLPGYRERGDAEIWRLHPYDRTLTAWRRQPDGSYVEQTFAGDAVVPLAAIRGARVDLAAVFD